MLSQYRSLVSVAVYRHAIQRAIKSNVGLRSFGDWWIELQCTRTCYKMHDYLFECRSLSVRYRKVTIYSVELPQPFASLSYSIILPGPEM